MRTRHDDNNGRKSVGRGEDLYDSYETWKGWGRPFTFAAEQAEYFAGECRDLGIPEADGLEIGFGLGSFLDWTHKRSARVAGTKINQRMLEVASD